MVVPYRSMCWLAQIARSLGMAETVTQAIWERTESPKAMGPLGQALHEFRKLGWRCRRGWWQWTMPRTGWAVHLAHAPKEYVEHLFRESLMESQLAVLEKRRPRPFGGMAARLNRDLTLSELAMCAIELDKSLLMGALAGAIWTADRPHRRRLRPDDYCPYCTKGVREDRDHLLWWCTAWKTAKEPFLLDAMLPARVLTLGALSEWPPCLRLCGLLPESVVAHNGLMQGSTWKKSARSCTGSLDIGCWARGRIGRKPADRGQSLPWRGRNGQPKTAICWSSLFINCTAYAWRYSRPE